MFVARFFLPARYVTLTRFRLRFLLQEIDLPQGDTLIGRSASCQVTLDDPLVSREHARIRIQGSAVAIEDLGSRNGVQVGGKAILRVAPLSNGERIRIGTQEFVFLAVQATDEPATRGATRQTGFLCHCANCARAYPEELLSCPACGGKDRLEDDTLTGSGTGQRDWGLELAADAVNRARKGKGTEALERVLAHARLGLERRLAEGQKVERTLVDGVGLGAAEVAVSRGEAGWGRWALSIYASLGMDPPVALSELLLQLPTSERALLAAAAQRALDSASGGDVASRDALSRLLGSKP
jgi:pSer/pThr/pTyr-binding forkhead associated (FHA) protein